MYMQFSATRLHNSIYFLPRGIFVAVFGSKTGAGLSSCSGAGRGAKQNAIQGGPDQLEVGFRWIITRLSVCKAIYSGYDSIYN